MFTKKIVEMANECNYHHLANCPYQNTSKFEVMCNNDKIVLKYYKFILHKSMFLY